MTLFFEKHELVPRAMITKERITAYFAKIPVSYAFGVALISTCKIEDTAAFLYHPNIALSIPLDITNPTRIHNRSDHPADEQTL